VDSTADQGSFFIGAKLADKPGMFAALTEELAEAGVSIDKLIQESAGDTGAAPVAILTHPCPRASAERRWQGLLTSRSQRTRRA